MITRGELNPDRTAPTEITRGELNADRTEPTEINRGVLSPYSKRQDSDTAFGGPAPGSSFFQFTQKVQTPAALPQSRDRQGRFVARARKARRSPRGTAHGMKFLSHDPIGPLKH